MTESVKIKLDEAKSQVANLVSTLENIRRSL